MKVFEPNPPAIVKSVDLDISALAFEANAAIEAGDINLKKGIERYREAGLALLKAKELVPYGKWSRWLEDNITCSHKHACVMMKVARNWGQVQELTSGQFCQKSISLLAEEESTEDEEPQEPTSKPPAAAAKPAESPPPPPPAKQLCPHCLRCQRTGQAVRINCADCRDLAKGVQVHDREAGNEQEGKSKPKRGRPPKATTEQQTAPSPNGKELFSVRKFIDHAGKLLPMLDQLAEQYGHVRQPARPGLSSTIEETPEHKELIAHIQKLFDLTRAWEAKLKEAAGEEEVYVDGPGAMASPD